MRSYQVNITVHSPITLRLPDRADDPEAMLRFLGDLLADVAVNTQDIVMSQLNNAKQQALEAGFILDIPLIEESMGPSFGITDVTGHIGKKWRPKK